MKNEITEIRVESGIGRVWQSRPGEWIWAHPNGSAGSGEPSFEDAVEAVEDCERAAGEGGDR